MTSWRQQLMNAVADHPTSFAGRLAALRFGRPSTQHSVAVTEFADRPIRVFIGPVNYSAQANAWARALERADPRVSAQNMSIAVPGGFAFDTSLEVPVSVYHNGHAWQRREFESVASGATHALIEALEPPFGRLFGRSVSQQVLALQARGVRVGYLQHGTEVRIPSRHAATVDWSYYRDANPAFERAEVVAQRNVDALAAVSEPVFVSTPDLLSDIPFATWCPVVVDPDAWRVPRVIQRATGPLRVTHAPTNPSLKGTPLIEPMLHRLHASGVIELRLAHGIPSEQMRELYANTDVYLDQFRLGSYGVAACEAMAAGCAVIGHVSDDVRQRVLASTGQSLPIVQATPDTLEATLRELADQLTRLPEIGAEGSAFVSAVHDGRLSSSVLLDGFLLR